MSPDNMQPQQPQQPQQSGGVQPPVVPSYQPQQNISQAPTDVDPGHGLGIASLVTSFFIGILGVILGIVAFNKSKKAGHKNGMAVAGIIIGGINMVTIIAVIILTILAAQVAIKTVSNAVREGGTVTINGVTTGGTASNIDSSSVKAVIDDLYSSLNKQTFSTMAVGSSITISSDNSSITIDPKNNDISDISDISDTAEIRVNTPIITYIDEYFSQKDFTKKVGLLDDSYIGSSVDCKVDHADSWSTIDVDCSDSSDSIYF